MTAKTPAERQQALRKRGLPLGLTLHSRAAIRKLSELSVALGSVRLAVEFALIRVKAPKSHAKSSDDQRQ